MPATPEPPTIDIVAGIREAAASSIMPDDLAASIAEFREMHPSVCNMLAEHVIAVACSWLIDALKRTADERVAEQVALQQINLALAMVAKGMKARRGEALSPGRMAIAAYIISDAVASKESEALKLEDAEELLDSLLTPIERERDRRREVMSRLPELVMTCVTDAAYQVNRAAPADRTGAEAIAWTQPGEAWFEAYTETLDAQLTDLLDLDEAGDE